MADNGIVAVFGSMNMDLSVACERMPRAGETVGGSGFITNAGGKGANQAVAAARVGVEFVARRDDVETGTATIIRCESDNRIVLSPGANHALTGDDVACALRYLVADELDRDACGLAPAAGSVFIAQGECDLMATAEALAKGAGAAVITLGGAGSVTLGDDGEPLRMPALSSSVVDTTAAGDTFIGALAAARLEGLPLFECMAAGARASAVTVSRLGAQQSIPTRAEVEHWFG